MTPRVTGVDDATVEPTTNYAVLRAQQDLRGGEAGISVIATARESLARRSDATSVCTAAPTRRARRSAIAFTTASTSSLGSSRHRTSTGSPEVIAAHAAERRALLPAAGRRLRASTPTRTSLPVTPSSSSSASTAAASRASRRASLGSPPASTSTTSASSGARIILDWSTWARAHRSRNAHGIYRWVQVNGNHWEQWNTSGTRLENAFNFNGHMGLKNNWDVHMGSTFAQPDAELLRSLHARWSAAPPVARHSPRGAASTPTAGESCRPACGRTSGSPTRATRTGWSLQPVREPAFLDAVPDQHRAELLARPQRLAVVRQLHRRATSVTHYSFAHLDQRTVSMSTRLNYTVTPNLTFEFYGQPFVSTGTYSDVREVERRRRTRRSTRDRFMPYTPPADQKIGVQVHAAAHEHRRAVGVSSGVDAVRRLDAGPPG